MSKRTIKHTQDSDILCKSMYKKIYSLMSEWHVVLWIPAECIMPEWIPRFEALGLYFETYEKQGQLPLILSTIKGEEQMYEYLVRNKRGDKE